MFLNLFLTRTEQRIIGIANRFMFRKLPFMISGAGSLFELPLFLEKKGIKKPMIVTGETVVKLESVQKLLSAIPSSYVYSQVKSDPLESQIELMAGLYKQNDCDGIIAIGGGSNIDAAKAMGILVAYKGAKLAKFEGLLKVHKKLPYLIAVPTTAGKGSECTIGTVITEDKTGRKYPVDSPVICPKAVVHDPELTVSLPEKLTVNTGLDALSHAIEAFLNKPYHTKNTKKYVVDAIQKIAKNLPIVFNDGSNLQARMEMLQASFYAGAAISEANIGNAHAIAHAIGGQFHLQHGFVVAVVLPYVLRKYLPEAEKALSELCEIAGLERKDSDAENAETFISWLEDFNRILGIPDKIFVQEFTAEKLSIMAEYAEKESNPLYPCPVMFSKNDFRDIINEIIFNKGEPLK